MILQPLFEILQTHLRVRGGIVQLLYCPDMNEWREGTSFSKELLGVLVRGGCYNVLPTRVRHGVHQSARVGA